MGQGGEHLFWMPEQTLTHDFSSSGCVMFWVKVRQPAIHLEGVCAKAGILLSRLEESTVATSWREGKKRQRGGEGKKTKHERDKLRERRRGWEYNYIVKGWEVIESTLLQLLCPCCDSCCGRNELWNTLDHSWTMGLLPLSNHQSLCIPSTRGPIELSSSIVHSR